MKNLLILVIGFALSASPLLANEPATNHEITSEINYELQELPVVHEEVTAWDAEYSHTFNQEFEGRMEWNISERAVSWHAYDAETDILLLSRYYTVESTVKSKRITHFFLINSITGKTLQLEAPNEPGEDPYIIHHFEASSVKYTGDITINWKK